MACQEGVNMQIPTYHSNSQIISGTTTCILPRREQHPKINLVTLRDLSLWETLTNAVEADSHWKGIWKLISPLEKTLASFILLYQFTGDHLAQMIHCLHLFYNYCTLSDIYVGCGFPVQIHGRKQFNSTGFSVTYIDAGICCHLLSLSIALTVQLLGKVYNAPLQGHAGKTVWHKKHSC